jgi:hypothetical protein
MTTRVLAGPDRRFLRRTALRGLMNPSAAERLELDDLFSPRRVIGSSRVLRFAV